jgi:hypothetical protein
MRTTSRAIGCLALLAICSPARGELVYFVRGGQAQLPATIQGKTVRLDTTDGPRSFPIEDFLAIIPGHDPEAGWPEQREAASKAGTVEARFAASWWALENGLTHQAIAMLKESRPTAPGHGPTLRCLASLEALSPPCPDPDLESLRDRLRPARFRETRGDHVLLLHQATESEARERLDVLERVVATFYLTLAAQGIELPPPRRRLISVWFADRRDYVQFLRHAEAEPFVDTQGYYHPTMHVVFAFDTRSTEAQRTGRRAIANRKREGAAESDLARQTLLLDLEWRAVDLGIAAHETVHQVAVASGFSPRLDDFPSWLHEGFASQFEVVRGGRWAGVGRVHDLRLPDWRAIRPAPRLAPLLRDVGLGHGYQRDRYAESWALVYFLRKAQPAEFRTFLDLLRAPSPDSSTRPDRAVEAFRSAFGNDISGLESEWRGYLEGRETPLESGRPGPSGRESRLARPVVDH